MPVESYLHPQQRRSTRLQFRCPVEVRAADSERETPGEETETVSISKFGAALRASRPYTLGQVVSVRTKKHGHVGLFEVVWVGRPGTSEAGQIGIELLDARRFWGIEFPPDDWSDSQ